MKDLKILAASTIILAPVFIAAMCTNIVVVFVGILYGTLLCAVSHHPRVRKFIVAAYRAQLRLFSGRLVVGL